MPPPIALLCGTRYGSSVLPGPLSRRSSSAVSLNLLYGKANELAHLKNESLEVRAAAVVDLMHPFLHNLDRQLLTIDEASEQAAVVLGLLARLKLC